MAKEPRRTEKTVDKKYSDPMFLPILVPDRLEPGEFEAQAWIDDTLYRKLDELEDEWQTLIKKIGLVVAKGTDGVSDAVALEEVSVQIGFNAKGKLVFVAEAGVNASFNLKFKIK